MNPMHSTLAVAAAVGSAVLIISFDTDAEPPVKQVEVINLPDVQDVIVVTPPGPGRYSTPYAIMASATFTNPAMLAPFT